MYTDPSGEFAWFAPLIGAMMGGFMNVAMNAGNIENIGQAFLYLGVGAISGFAGGAIGAGVGAAVSVAGFAGGFINGAANTWIQGGEFAQGLVNGLKSGAIFGAIAGITGGLIGGMQAKMAGGSFGTGAFMFKDVAPALLTDKVALNATMGHELIHAIHMSSFSRLCNNFLGTWKSFSESAACNYNYNVYMNAGRYFEAMQYYRRGIIYLSAWGTYLHSLFAY
jgi:hypothetical protein